MPWVSFLFFGDPFVAHPFAKLVYLLFCNHWLCNINERDFFDNPCKKSPLVKKKRLNSFSNYNTNPVHAYTNGLSEAEASAKGFNPR